MRNQTLQTFAMSPLVHICQKEKIELETSPSVNKIVHHILVASNEIQTKDNGTIYLIIHCLNCISRDQNSAHKRTALTDPFQITDLHNASLGFRNVNPNL